MAGAGAGGSDSVITECLDDGGQGYPENVIAIGAGPVGRLTVISSVPAIDGGLVVHRLLVDGSPDEAWAPGGCRVSFQRLEPTAAAVRSDGSIIAGGHDHRSGGFALWRVDPAGAVDPEFGDDGSVAIEAQPSRVVVSDSGLVYVASDAGIDRRRGDGSRDSTWVGSGRSGVTGPFALDRGERVVYPRNGS